MPINKNPTVENIVSFYLDNHVLNKYAKSTYDSYKSKMRKYVVPLIGTEQVRSLKKADVQNLIDILEHESYGLSSNSIRQIHSIFHRILNFAVDVELVDRNVSNRVTLPKYVKYQPKIYSQADADRLLDMSINDFLYIPIYIAVKTGLRRSEILSLRWKDIDLNKNTISVTEGKSRNSVRTLEIPSSLSEALTERKIFQNFSLQVNDIEQTDDTFVVCRTNGKPYNPTYISRRFTEFVEVNNLPPVRFHDLRHYFAVSAHNNGVPIKTLSLALGHTSAAATVDNYVNIEYDDFIPIS